MLNFLKENHKKILIIIVVLLLIGVINLLGSDKNYNPVEGLVIDMLQPEFAVVSNIRDWAQDMVNVILNYQQVKKENQKLKDKVASLRREQKYSQKILRENQRLRKLLNFKQQVPYQVVGASVISYSTDNWSNILMINRGKEDGIRRKMSVIAKEGHLIGKVQRVTSHTAQIMLLNDPNFVIGGLVSRKASRDLGLVKGQAEGNKLVMNNLSWDANIKSGDMIVSSGLSQYYPKGLPLGKVISVSPDNYGLTQQAMIKPAVDLNKIEEVLVITDFTTKANLLPSLWETNSNLKEELQ